MDMLRNFAAVALLAVAAFNPAHAEEAANANDAGASVDSSRLDDVRKALQDNPEIAALVGGTDEKAVTDALKEQLAKHGVKNGEDLKALAGEGNQEALAGALKDQLAKHGVQDGEDLEALAGDGKKKAIADALKKYANDNPEEAEALERQGKALAAALKDRLK